MKIYTKTGDKGYTSLIGGSRVPKHHLRIESYGTVDELNAYIGLIRDQNLTEPQKQILAEIQNCLFIIGSSLASEIDNPDDQKRKAMKLPDLRLEDIELLETEMDSMNEDLPQLKNFILPGGSNSISICHLARCVCRRAERNVVHLAEDNHVNELIVVYLNRLSDYLFVLARKLSSDQNIPEILWHSRV